MDYLTLEGGVKMPMVGYGVFQIDAKETERCVSDALAVGYRAIDTAQAYYNEEGVGAAVAKSGIPRDEIFLTTKVWISNAGDKKAAASIDESLRKLGTDYIDLLLIHQHYGDYYGTWRAMEAALKAGKVRAIGLSNFDPARITDLMLSNTVKPAMLQVQANVFTQQNALQTFCRLGLDPDHRVEPARTVRGRFLHEPDTRLNRGSPREDGRPGRAPVAPAARDCRDPEVNAPRPDGREFPAFRLHALRR